MHADEPQRLVGARKECPLVAGVGEGETFLASAIPAFLADTRTAVPIENGEIVEIEAGEVRITDAEGNPIEREPEEVTWDADAAEKGGYETFMLKEIHEQADAVAETIADRLPGDDGVDLSDVDARRRLPARPAADRDRRLRHLLPRRPDRPLRDRGVGAGAGRDGHRLRVPLPQPGGRPRRPGDRDDPVGRDRRHAGGDAAGPRGRRQGAGGDQHHGQPGDPRRRRRPLHPRRARDRRRRDQDLRRPGGGDVPARAAAGRAARDAAGGADRRAGGRAEGAAVEDRGDAGGGRGAGARRSPPPTASRTSSSTSAATSACRSASRGR